MYRVTIWMVSRLRSELRAVRDFRMACLSRRSTVGPSLWARGYGVRKHSLEAGQPTSSRSILTSSSVAFPSFCCTVQGQRRLAGARSCGALRKQRGALHLNLADVLCADRLL